MNPYRRKVLADLALSVATTSLFSSCASRGWLSARGVNMNTQALFDQIATELLVDMPQEATSIGVDSGELAYLRHRLRDRSADASASAAQRNHDRLQRLQRVNATSLTQLDVTTLKALIFAHEIADEGARFAFGDNNFMAIMGQEATPYVVNQMIGQMWEIPEFLSSKHPLNDADDADAYLGRLGDFAKNLDAEAQCMLRDSAIGVVAPNFVLETVVKQGRAFCATSGARFVSAQRLAIRAASLAANELFVSHAVQLFETRVLPAARRQLHVAEKLFGMASNAAGVQRLPDGEEYYAWALRMATTTNLGAKEIHAIGLAQSREIDAVMDTSLRKLGFGSGSVAERTDALGRDPKMLFPNDEAGKRAALAYVEQLIERVRSRMSEVSHLKLQARVEVKRVPQPIEEGAPGAYVFPGGINGSRPSTFYLNLRDTSTWPRWSLPTITHHETLPGHAWQEAYGIEAKGIPLIRAILRFNSYSEGWALYAEKLAEEMGIYADDPHAHLGYLAAEQLRATRLVVDTGLHAFGWTREQAIASINATGKTIAAATSEVDRYCVKPGQACGYKIGQMEILNLRSNIKEKQGQRFSLQAFNDAIITAGNVPLSVLKEIINVA
jgi:uncharacterized protein (DUF885 family)